MKTKAKTSVISSAKRSQSTGSAGKPPTPTLGKATAASHVKRMARNGGGTRAAPSAPRFIMLGGFLGAGKTTTVLRVAQYFQKLGKRVGLITNDQAAGLVDTALLEELQLPVREIAGGCFCCKSEGLVEALERHTRETQPEVFIAEPVGSCTDLIATVSLPLEKIYQQGYVMAPYAVLVDPYRAMQTLGVEGKPLFSSDVNYIYRKQLEEAEIICINKVDVLEPGRLARLRAALELEYPEARIVEMSSRHGQGMEPLFEALATTEGKITKVMDVDYARYGVGEALLGWVNVRVKLTWDGLAAHLPGPRTEGRRRIASEIASGSEVDGLQAHPTAWLLGLVGGIQKGLKRRKMEIAHLKASLSGDATQRSAGLKPAGNGKAVGGKASKPAGGTQPSSLCYVTAVQLVHSAGVPEVTRRMEVPFTEGELLINLRAEGDPVKLAAAVTKALADAAAKVPGLTVEVSQMEHFRPGQPKPTHRVGRA